MSYALGLYGRQMGRYPREGSTRTIGRARRFPWPPGTEPPPRAPGSGWQQFSPDTGNWQPMGQGAAGGKPIHAGVGVAPYELPDTDLWYEGRGVDFAGPDSRYYDHPYGEGKSQQGIEVPDWAAGEFTSARAFYQWWDSMDPDEQMRARTTLSAINRQRERMEEQRTAALTTLGGARTDLETRMQEFLDNAEWNTLVTSLEGRVAGEDPAVTPEELTASRLTLAQRYAQVDAAAQADAAGRGVGTSGNVGQRLAPMQVYTDVGGLQLKAQAAALNRGQQLTAEATLARVLQGRESMVMAYQGELDRLSAMIAQIETGGDFEPTDLLAFDELSYAMDAFEEAMARAEANETEAREAAEWGLEDWLALGATVREAFT